MSQALYRKWRPQSWQKVVGQQHVVDTLRNALSAGRVGHAYLFSGPRGTGKTTTARLLAKAVNCLDKDPKKRPCGQCEYCQAVNEGRFLDLIEIDAASNTSVDDVRDLRDKINYSPNQGHYKVYIIDEVHMLSNAAFNALLKTLEEPPPHAIFILATTEIHKIPATVLSRCQRHDFRRIPVKEIVDCLRDMAQSEKIDVNDDVLQVIARQSTGAMRDAISLLDQLASSGDSIQLEKAQEILGVAASQSVIEVVQALVEKQVGAGLDSIHTALDGGSDSRQFSRQIVDYLRSVLLVQMGCSSQVDATKDVREKMAQHAEAFSTPDLLRIIRSFNFAATDARSSWQPALPLEMAFIEGYQEPEDVIVPDSKIKAPKRSPAPREKVEKNPDSADPRTAKSDSETVSSAPVDRAVSSPKRNEVLEASPQDQQATQTLAEAWPKILNLVRKQNSKANGLLNSSKGRFMRGNDVYLIFASDIIKENMEKKENLETVELILSKVFQRQVSVKCQVDTAQRDAIPAGVDDDGMVAAALRDLGGEIVDMQ
jgi:DNA polymerase-3 subunit gamma/tau